MFLHMSLWKGSKHQGTGQNAMDRNQKLFVLMRGQFLTGHHSQCQTGQSCHINMIPDKAPAIHEMVEFGATILTTAQAGIARVRSQISGSTLKYFLFPLSWLLFSPSIFLSLFLPSYFLFPFISIKQKANTPANQRQDIRRQSTKVRLFKMNG